MRKWCFGRGQEQPNACINTHEDGDRVTPPPLSHTARERETDRERERDRETETEAYTGTHTHTHAHTHMHTHTHTHTDLRKTCNDNLVGRDALLFALRNETVDALHRGSNVLGRIPRFRCEGNLQ